MRIKRRMDRSDERERERERRLIGETNRDNEERKGEGMAWRSHYRVQSD